MSLRDDLIAARAVIDTPEKWCKGIGPDQCCAMYAVNEVGNYFGSSSRWGEMNSALIGALPAKYRRSLGHPVVAFNDADDTTHADIMKLFNDAIERASR